MYPEEIVLPMREELTSVGFTQVTSSSEIESAIKSSGTTLVVRFWSTIDFSLQIEICAAKTCAGASEARPRTVF